MKKFLRRTGLTALIVLCSLSLAALHIGLYLAAAEEGYVQNITLRETAAGELSITVSYRNIHHLYFEKKVFCAVYILDPGEETLYGDTGEEKLTADDGLGPYRIAICINLELGDSLYQKYPHRTVCEYRGASVPEGKYRIKISNLPSDIPESVIYIGSDFPLPVQEAAIPAVGLLPHKKQRSRQKCRLCLFKTILLLQKLLQCDALKKIVDHFIQFFPHRQCGAAAGARAPVRCTFQAGHRR